MAIATTTTSYAKGCESLEEEVVLDDLPTTGELPTWLSGSLLRTGPAKFEAGSHEFNHWFDGLAMLHRFTFGNGRVSYGTASWRAAQSVPSAGRAASLTRSSLPTRAAHSFNAC